MTESDIPEKPPRFEVIIPSEEVVRRREIREMLDRIVSRLFQRRLQQMRNLSTSSNNPAEYLKEFCEKQGLDYDFVERLLEISRPYAEDIKAILTLPDNHPRVREINARLAKEQAQELGWQVIDSEEGSDQTSA